MDKKEIYEKHQWKFKAPNEEICRYYYDNYEIAEEKITKKEPKVEFITKSLHKYLDSTVRKNIADRRYLVYYGKTMAP